MIDPCASHEDFEPDVQALVRTAAGLPRLSSDLRSRVVLAAHQCRAQRARRRRAVAVAAGVLLLSMLAPPAGRFAGRLTLYRPAPAAQGQAGRQPDRGGLLASNDRLWMAAATGDSWDLVDGFSRLRQEQLRMLQQAF